MEAAKVFAKLKELGHINSKREELREYCKLKIDQIIKFLPRRILNADGGELLDCLLNGIQDQPASSCKIKVKIIDIVLSAMRQESTSLTHCGDVINRLCLDLSRMPAEDLVRWCGDSVQTIVEDKDVNMIWKDVLPECLSALSSHIQVRHCGTDMTPAEYKEQCVRTLCQCQWREGQLVQLTAMFNDMQLSRSDHRAVVSKLCSHMPAVPPDSLPPLLHHLCKLCKSYDLELVLGELARYFGTRLYSKLEPPPGDSESTTMDIEEFAPYSPAELSRCLSTCIYHVTQGAAEPDLVRRLLKNWPKNQLLRSPLLIDLALALADKGADFRTTCLDIIKSAIEQRVVESSKSTESAWVRAALPPDVDAASVLKVLTTESTNHRQLTVVGLIGLGFNLLSTSRTRPAAPSCWSLGKLVLVRLCKQQPEAAPRVLSQLADRLAGEKAAPEQYADCLYVLCKLTPQSIERCSELNTILEGCQGAGAGAGAWRAAAGVLRAARPLLAGGARARDALLLHCRKGLYSRDSAHRCLALSGFLCVLRYARLARTTLSQMACERDSAHSYLTQLTVDLHSTQYGSVTSKVRNEAICMEVVSILRRCLVQDAAVKQLLYSSIYTCAKDKPVLHESILELLYEHLLRFLPEEGGPLRLDKCVTLTATSALLTEPIGHLLYSVAQFLSSEEEELEDILESQSMETGSAFLKNKLQTVMEKLTECEALYKVDMEEGGLSDLTPESKARHLQSQQALQCYEALVAHHVLRWTPDSATVVYELYKKYAQLIDQAKAPSKTAKKAPKGTQNDPREVNKSQKSQKSQKENTKAPIKLASLVKDRAGPFKPLPCVWDLCLCLRVLELLYSEDLPWCTSEQRNSIRSRRDFHHFALKNSQSVLSDEHLEKQDIGNYCVKMAALMYRRCLCRYQDMCDFDDETALLCLDVFKDCLTMLLAPNGFKPEIFMSKITGDTEGTLEASLALILEQTLSSLSATEEDSETEDAQSRKALMQIASLLLEQVGGKAELTDIVSKWEDYARHSKFDCLPLIPSLLNAGCSLNQDSKLLDDLLARLTQALGKIDEEETSGGQETELFPYIDERSGHLALTQACSHLLSRITHAELLLSRAKQLDTPGNTHLNVETELNSLSKSLLLQLCQLSTWSGRCAALRCAVGVASERVLTLAVRLYAVLTAAVRRITASEAVAHAPRLERLLKLSGKKLSATTDTLITYLEQAAATGSSGRVLRDTRLIPRLVLRAEQLSRQALLLGRRAGMNLQQYVSLGTARDFRIKAPVLQEVLHNQNDETRYGEGDINDADTLLSPRGSDEDDEAPPKRKRKS